MFPLAFFFLFPRLFPFHLQIGQKFRKIFLPRLFDLFEQLVETGAGDRTESDGAQRRVKIVQYQTQRTRQIRNVALFVLEQNKITIRGWNIKNKLICSKFEGVSRFKQIEPQNASLFCTAILMLLYLTDAGLYLAIMTMVNTDLADPFVHKMASKGSVNRNILLDI